MLNLKQKKLKNISKNYSNLSGGFTLLELMVVITIITLLTTALVINLNSQKANREIKIAQNQLVSDLRKIMSYTLAARNTPSAKNAQFYIIKFDLATPTKYYVQAISNASSNPQMETVETLNLPAGIKIGGLTPIVISQRQASPTTQNLIGTDCALVAFAAPFGKTILNKGCSITTSPGGISLTNASDDYGKIVNFQTNAACDTNSNPPSCTASTDSLMTITLTDIKGQISKTVSVNAVTGVVTFN